MDPAVVLRLIKRGEMPNMKRLSDRGVFTMMESSLPPQSPVAWGTFIAGADPGVTGIFDFIHRNPENYTPMFSQSETQPGKWVVKLGKIPCPPETRQSHTQPRRPGLLGLPAGPGH